MSTLMLEGGGEEDTQQRRPVLLLLCGLPGAGKSSLAQSLVRHCSDVLFLHLNLDELLRQWCEFRQIHGLDPITPAAAASAQTPTATHQHCGNAGLTGLEQWHESRLIMLLISRLFVDEFDRVSTCSEPNHCSDALQLQFEFAQLYLSRIRTSSVLDRPERRRTSISVLILDDNFYYRGMRAPFFRLAQEKSVGFVQIFLQVPVDRCIQNNEKRQQRQLKQPSTDDAHPLFMATLDRNMFVTAQRIRDMASRIEFPCASASSTESDWDAHYGFRVDLSDTLRSSCDADVLSSVERLISEACTHPAVGLKEAHSATSPDDALQNIVHQMDIETRKIAGGVIRQKIASEQDPGRKQQIPLLVNQIRKDFMADFSREHHNHQHRYSSVTDDNAMQRLLCALAEQCNAV